MCEEVEVQKDEVEGEKVTVEFFLYQGEAFEEWHNRFFERLDSSVTCLRCLYHLLC